MIKCKQQIAILLASYNGEKYLCEQIDSIISQSFTDWHLYIHDDGSNDNTLAIIKDYADKLPEKITLLEYPSQGGACNNFFSILERVDAPYYMFSDQDDVWMKNKIETCYNRIKQLEGSNAEIPIIVHSDLVLVDSELNIIDDSFIRNQNINIDKVVQFIDYAYTNIVTGCTMLFNSAAVECVKLPRTKARMHDSWITLSVVANEGTVSFVNHPLIYYRQHGNNTLGAKDMSMFNVCNKLRNIVAILKEIMGHYREMNEIKQISLLDYFRARIRYKHD